MLINLDNLILGNECEKQGSHSSGGAGQLWSTKSCGILWSSISDHSSLLLSLKSCKHTFQK